MLQVFYPDEYLDSTYRIDFEQKYHEGYRGIIFDVDNTLVEHGFPADARAKAACAGLSDDPVIEQQGTACEKLL